MSKFAIIKLGPNQYRLEEGKTYVVPRFSDTEAETLSIDEVMAAGDDKNVQFGTPFLSKASVKLDVLGYEKGEKVTSRIFKAKARYRRTRGFRKQVTRIKVNSISF